MGLLHKLNTLQKVTEALATTLTPSVKSDTLHFMFRHYATQKCFIHAYVFGQVNIILLERELKLV